MATSANPVVLEFFRYSAPLLGRNTPTVSRPSVAVVVEVLVGGVVVFVGVAVLVGVLVGVAVLVDVLVGVAVWVGVIVAGGTAEKFAATLAVPLACFTLRYKSVVALSKYQVDPVAASKVFNELAGEITAPLIRICCGPELVRINIRTSEPVAFSKVSDRV